MRSFCWLFILCLGLTTLNVSSLAQQPPYDQPIAARAPYYRVRYEASQTAGELVYPVSYTVWIPPQVKTLRGLVVHQHGCGEGSCKSGVTGAYDLHWQALAKKHDCALMSPVVEQPDKADCQMWCDPRNGSDRAFQKALTDLAAQSGHPELASVPWALWGHSGGGHWAGGMLLLHPDRVAAAWLRSGVPSVQEVAGKPKPYAIPAEALNVPIMCNLGTQEGVTVRNGQFSGVWSGVETFFQTMRGQGSLVGVAIDPLSSHDCGNQRYLAIPWFDACLSVRLSGGSDNSLHNMRREAAWLAPLSIEDPTVGKPTPIAQYQGSVDGSVWLPSESMAIAWTQYIKDTRVEDKTPPPAPTDLQVNDGVLTWHAEADLESGLSHFMVERDGQFLANVPEQGKNPFGRPIFQNLQYSDTPSQPLVEMRFVDNGAEKGKTYQYRIKSVNTVGSVSE